MRYVAGIEYDGSGFYGWQWQTQHRSVQAVLEQALSHVADHPLTVICAGRTDTGVHALEQVIHFDATPNRGLHAWMRGGNSKLPDDVRITWVQTATIGFHARYSAVARFYRYIILNRPVKSALLRQQATWCPAHLDVEKMHLAAQHLIGQHDFSSFRAQGCQSKSPMRAMYFIDVYRQGEQIIIDISANAFLHHMVRNIAGVLMAIGQGKQPVDWTLQLLALKSRKLGGITAPPDGLYLGGVYYPEHFGIAKHPIFNKLPPDAKRFD
ncbi:MAG: tRNA pseudouridine(38-40) synthase TruA [Methylococcales bacterium]|nr:tRNA pseudouridine(38-40) synthase TruA [Methylococcales bacterium]